MLSCLYFLSCTKYTFSQSAQMHELFQRSGQCLSLTPGAWHDMTCTGWHHICWSVDSWQSFVRRVRTSVQLLNKACALFERQHNNRCATCMPTNAALFISRHKYMSSKKSVGQCDGTNMHVTDSIQEMAIYKVMYKEYLALLDQRSNFFFNIINSVCCKKWRERPPPEKRRI